MSIVLYLHGELLDPQDTITGEEFSDERISGEEIDKSGSEKGGDCIVPLEEETL